MCFHESKDKSNPSNNHSSTAAGSPNNTTKRGFDVWVRCQHCPRTWKSEDDSDIKDNSSYNLTEIGFTKTVVCEECRAKKAASTSKDPTESIDKRGLFESPTSNEALSVSKFMTMMYNDISRSVNNSSLFKNHSLIQQMANWSNQKISTCFKCGLSGFNNFTELFYHMNTEHCSSSEVKENEHHKTHNSVQDKKRCSDSAEDISTKSIRNKQTDQHFKHHKDLTIDLNQTKITMNEQMQTYQKTFKNYSWNPFNVMLDTNNKELCKQGQSNTTESKISELSKYFKDTEIAKSTESQKKKTFSSPSMQSLAEIGRSPGAIWKADSNVNEIETFNCLTCNKTFKSSSLLKIHQKAHITSDRFHKCHLCEFSTGDHDHLSSHIRQVHPEHLKTSVDWPSTQETTSPKCKPATCPVCGRKSPSLGYLKIHMRSHKTTLDHVCKVCGRGFKEHWYLTTHLRTHDKGLISHPHFNGTHPDGSRRTQRNEVNEQIRQMIERNKQSNGVFRTDLQSPIMSLNNQNLLLAAAAEPCRKTFQSALPSSSSPNQQKVSEQEELEQYRNRVSKRKAFHPMRYGQDGSQCKRPAPTEIINHYQTSTRRKSKPQKLEVDLQDNKVNDWFIIDLRIL